MRSVWALTRASRRSSYRARSWRRRSTSTGKGRAPWRFSSRRWAAGSRTSSRSGRISLRSTTWSRSSRSIPPSTTATFCSGSILEMVGQFWRIGMLLLFTSMENLRYILFSDFLGFELFQISLIDSGLKIFGLVFSCAECFYVLYFDGFGFCCCFWYWEWVID